MKHSVKMQRALEICVEYSEQGSLAYRKVWPHKYIGIRDGEVWWLENGEKIERYTPSVEDIETADWDYEF